MIKAVVFDLDGVYFENGTTTFINSLIVKYGLEEELIKEIYFRSSQMKEYKQGKITGEEYWNWAIEAWNIDSTKEDITKMLIDSYNVKEDTQEYVKKLRDRGIKTAICTNNFPERLNGLRRAFNLDSYFDVIVASFQIGITKPAPEIFAELSKQLNSKPNEIIMSDDREENVLALRKLGFNAIGYTNFNTFVTQIEDLLNKNNR